MHRLREAPEYRRAEVDRQVERYWSEINYRARKIARTRAQHALDRGEIQRAPCSCGNPDPEMHHEDYSKPLEVTWLCRPCHLLEHYGPDYPEPVGDPIADLLRRFDARRQLRKAEPDMEWVLETRGKVA